MKLNKRSAWSKDQVFAFLDNERIPMRLAVIGADSYPLVCSLWFIRDGEVLWAASHRNAHIITLLAANKKAGFEVATNSYPYKGVRGKADIELVEDRSVDVLDKLVARYLQGGNKKLASWLLSRKQEEYAIKIVPRLVTSWDFSHRMTADK